MFSSNVNLNSNTNNSIFETKKMTAFVTIIFFSFVLSGIFFWGNQGLGFFAGTILVTLICNARLNGFRKIGFFAPESWVTFINQSIILAVLLTLFDLFFLQPLSHSLFNELYQTPKLDPMRGNISLLYYFIAFGWFGIAFSEEYIFRGFFLKEFKEIFGDDIKAWVLSALICSLIVGLLH